MNSPRVLEIGPGMGRWTQRLLRHAHSLDVVDISQKALEGLEEKVLSKLLPLDRSLVKVHLGSGTNLPVGDSCIDFVFSFDSLVHADQDCLDAYLLECYRILVETGVGIIHHANHGPGHWRGNATAEGVLLGCESAGLHCYVQEITPWVHEQHAPLDCITLFGKKPMTNTYRQRVVTNMLEEATRARHTAWLYSQIP